MNLNDAKILITGGSSGLGKAMAEVLVEAGAKVLITGRNAKKVAEVAQQIGCLGLPFDISDYQALPNKAAESIEKLGGIDVLINNAGIGEFPLLGEITLEHFERVFSTNVFGLTLFTQELLPHFKTQQRGSIINIASTAALKGFARGSIYAASKFALRALTQCWQAELRPLNIRVMQINPSEVPTAFNQADRIEKPTVDYKLTPTEIAHSIKAVLEMDDRGMVPELSVWATNPWGAQ
ncbi:SDR family oxidoreductase [Aureispira anguillae]|uniref:SDR family oxidoreductase n=1 Tax=Aureispira anguillae TaxID=2864201 RepID=A0A915YBU1_9BACT|nr:SDR family oxidoreductase [Aureispira anguillae]BDS10205.1 SDR family oxidoreductase [Aureispira anguillae]